MEKKYYKVTYTVNTKVEAVYEAQDELEVFLNVNDISKEPDFYIDIEPTGEFEITGIDEYPLH